MTANKKRSPRKVTLSGAIKQVQKSGLAISRVEIEPSSGKITIVTGDGESTDVANNPWDSVLTGDGRRRGP